MNWVGWSHSLNPEFRRRPDFKLSDLRYYFLHTLLNVLPCDGLAWTVDLLEAEAVNSAVPVS